MKCIGSTLDSTTTTLEQGHTGNRNIYVLKILKKLILAHFSKSKNMSSLEPIVGLSIPYLIQELNETQNTNK